MIRVVGGGLAGCEAALFLADKGEEVELIDIKPTRFTPAHGNAHFAELVCSNSLKSNRPDSASWLLKEEMKMLGSRLIPAAEVAAVPAGGALAVDREIFSTAITNAVRNHPLIRVTEREYAETDDSVPTIIATGPLTTDALSQSVAALAGEKSLYFFDAAAPIVDASTIDYSRVFTGSRYESGEGDYLNCPMTRQEYYAFVDELISAQSVSLKDFEGSEVFEGCMPIEVMAKRGRDTLRFGPLKPAGLRDCYAAVQLRAENAEKSGYNIVGFQTNLIISEQKRIFKMIAGLENAEFFRFGVMHRNTYLDCPKALDKTMRFKSSEQLYVAGQLSGVEGYVESMASGLVVARYLYQKKHYGQIETLPRTTMTGALLSAITIPVGNFQPVNANFGILPPLSQRYKEKEQKNTALCARALHDLREYLDKDFQEKTPKQI